MNTKLYLLVAAALALTACHEIDPEDRVAAGKNAVVDRLFTVDDCTVYRFFDQDRDHYFTKCVDGDTVTNEKYRSGKVTVEEQIPTSRPRRR